MILLDIFTSIRLMLSISEVRMALPCPCYYIQCGRLRFANTLLHRAPHRKETLTIRAVTPAQAGVQLSVFGQQGPDLVTPAQAGVQTDVVSQKHWIPVCTGMTRELVLSVSKSVSPG